MRTLRPTLDRSCARAVAACLAIIGSALPGSAAGGQQELPRYRLKVGQEVVYRTTDPPQETDNGQGGKNVSHYVTEWIVDVAGQNDNGTWWIVFREKITATNTYNGKASKQELTSDGHFRLSADGRLAENSTIRPMSNPTLLFPPLPSDAAQAANGWEASLTLDDTHRKFHTAGEPAADGMSRLVEEPMSALDPIYELTTARDYTFDRQQGLVRRIVSISKQGWPASQAGKSRVQTVELIETRELDTSDLAALAEQAQKYFGAVEEYERLAEQARGSFSRTAMGFVEAERELKKVRDSLTLPWLTEMLDARLAQHRRDAQFAIQDAVEFAKVLNRPSTDWQTTDLDGNPKALADLRGQVVVLDFWYRGCGWCIRAMPQMKQLANDFSGQEVAIFGINADKDLADARFVIDRLNLNYPTLKDGEYPESISAKYKVRGWPTLVVIDKKGLVRHLHFGYSPKLHSELTDKIRELLAEPPG